MRVIDLSTLSLVGGSGIAEAKILLWGADGTSTTSDTGTTAGSALLQDGSTSLGVPSLSRTQIFTLSSNWQASLNFALEVTFMIANASATANAALWDFSLGTPAIVANSTVSTTSTTMNVVRSAQYTLTPGHTYGVTGWTSNASYGIQFADASLIIFPS